MARLARRPSAGRVSRLSRRTAYRSPRLPPSSALRPPTRSVLPVRGWLAGGGSLTGGAGGCSRASTGRKARKVAASARYTAVKVTGWVTLTTAAAPRAPRPSPAFRQAWRTENTAERPAGPARLASSASWAGQITDTPRPSRPAAPNRAAGVCARASATVHGLKAGCGPRTDRGLGRRRNQLARHGNRHLTFHFASQPRPANATAREWLATMDRPTAREWLLSRLRLTAREWLLARPRYWMNMIVRFLGWRAAHRPALTQL